MSTRPITSATIADMIKKDAIVLNYLSLYL